MTPDLQAGLQFSWTYLVPPRATVPQLYADTAFCRDMPDVLATGYLVGMLELACANALIAYLDWPHEQSVGTMVNFRHLAATPPGMMLRIEGVVTKVEDRRVAFAVQAWDELDKIAEGTHERAIIARDRFNARLAEKIVKHQHAGARP